MIQALMFSLLLHCFGCERVVERSLRLQYEHIYMPVIVSDDRLHVTLMFLFISDPESVTGVSLLGQCLLHTILCNLMQFN